MRRAIEQASEAARFGSRVAGATGVHHFAELGIFRLLLPLADTAALASYVEGELGALLTHDSATSQPLLPTLLSFLENSGRISVTSSLLHIQRRTLYHRLARLSKLLGRDLSDSDVRLRLWVAMRGLDLLRRRDLPDVPGSQLTRPAV